MLRKLFANFWLFDFYDCLSIARICRWLIGCINYWWIFSKHKVVICKQLNNRSHRDFLSVTRSFWVSSGSSKEYSSHNFSIIVLGNGLDTAQRYGKGHAANESQAKPPNLDKNQTSKPPTGGASHLTGSLGQATLPKPNNHRPKTLGLAPFYGQHHQRWMGATHAQTEATGTPRRPGTQVAPTEATWPMRATPTPDKASGLPRVRQTHAWSAHPSHPADGANACRHWMCGAETTTHAKDGNGNLAYKNPGNHWGLRLNRNPAQTQKTARNHRT